VSQPSATKSSTASSRKASGAAAAKSAKALARIEEEQEAADDAASDSGRGGSRRGGPSARFDGAADFGDDDRDGPEEDYELGGAGAGAGREGKGGKIKGRGAGKHAAASALEEGADDGPRTHPKKRGRGRPPKDASSKRAAPAPSSGAGAKRGPGRPPKQPREEEEEEEEEEDFLSPGGTDQRRIRKSLGGGSHADEDEDGGRGKRRRWKPLQHWKGERVKYTEEGAQNAEKLGVLTPKLTSKRSRSKSKERTKVKSGKRSEQRERSVSRSASRSAPRDSGRGRSRYEEEEEEGQEEEDEEAPRSKVSRKGGKGGGVSDSAHADALEKAEVRASKRTAVAVYEASKGTVRQTAMDGSALPAGFSVSSSPNLVISSGGGMPMYQIGACPPTPRPHSHTLTFPLSASAAVIRQNKQLAYERLPSTGAKPPGITKPALAAAAFDAPEFISGTVRLEPRSCKDMESTHNCTQVFVVVAAHPQGLQVDIGPHCYLLSPGDHFFVPQNCEYRLVNHSGDTPAEVAFVVIKPKAAEGGEGGTSSAAATPR
jgi:hypothetical protein